LNVFFLEVTSQYLALTAMMNVLNGLCLLAVLKAAVAIHHLLPQRHVTPVQAKTVALVTENELGSQTVKLSGFETINHLTIQLLKYSKSRPIKPTKFFRG